MPRSALRGRDDDSAELDGARSAAAASAGAMPVAEAGESNCFGQAGAAGQETVSDGDASSFSLKYVADRFVHPRCQFQVIGYGNIVVYIALGRKTARRVTGLHRVAAGTVERQRPCFRRRPGAGAIVVRRA